MKPDDDGGRITKAELAFKDEVRAASSHYTDRQARLAISALLDMLQGRRECRERAGRGAGKGGAA